MTRRLPAPSHERRTAAPQDGSWNAGAVDLEEIAQRVATWEGVLALRPGPGDGSPEISWGDVFSVTPDGRVPSGLLALWAASVRRARPAPSCGTADHLWGMLRG